VEEREAPKPVDEEVEGHQLADEEKGAYADEEKGAYADEDVEGHAYDHDNLGRAATDAESLELGATSIDDQ
jgi:hypothetical protein